MEDTGYTLQCRTDDGTTITIDAHQYQDLTSMCELFQQLLKGAGFVFEGQVEIVVDEDEPNQKLKDLMRREDD